MYLRGRASARGATSRRSIPHGEQIELVYVPPSALCNTGRGMYYLVCGIVHIKA